MKGVVQQLLDHRVAAAGDVDAVRAPSCGRHRFRVRLRSAKVGEHVEFRDALRSARQRVEHRDQFVEQGLVERLLQRQRAFVRAQHPVLVRLQLRRDVAFRALQRLAALVVVRHPVGLQAADLDVIAVHPVVADFQVVDAGAFALAALHVQQAGIAALAQGAQLVEFRVITLCDHAAVADQLRREIPDGTRQQIAGVRMYADARRHIAGQRVVAACQ